MDCEDEDRICFKYHYYLRDESARKLSELIQRARSTTNKQEPRHLLSRADTLIYREYLTQRWKVGDLFLCPWEQIKLGGYKRIPPLKTFKIFHHVARTSDSNLLARVHLLLFGIQQLQID